MYFFSATTVRFPVDSFTTFDQPLKVEGLSKKLEEFNVSQASDLKLSDSEVKVVIGVAKGLVRISEFCNSLPEEGNIFFVFTVFLQSRSISSGVCACSLVIV